MKQTSMQEMINHQKLWLESGLSFEKWIENYLNKYLKMEKEQKNNLPIHIHEGISNTNVYIEDGIVHVKPNNETFKSE